MLLSCGVGEDFWESIGLQGDPTINCKRNQSWIFVERTDAEAPILWLPDAKNWLLGKDPDAGKDWRQEEKGTTEDETTGLHHWLNGHEFEQVLEAGDRQGSLACCSPWGRKNRAPLRDWTELNWRWERITHVFTQKERCRWYKVKSQRKRRKKNEEKTGND